MAEDILNPTEECDLVMKGGVTSGIVYPPTVLKLAAKYRFRNIGGTSAGAIAASVTAAAEFGRETETGGFKILQQVNEQLSQDRFLFNLFQPSKKTKQLYNVLTELFINSKILKARQPQTAPAQKSLPNRFFWFRQILQHQDKAEFSKGTSIGLLVGILLALALSVITFLVFVLIDGSLNWQSFIAPLLALGLLFSGLGWLLGGIGKSLYHLWNILTQEVPKSNNFGLCSGMGGSNVLTEWLSTKINEAAGRTANDQPLTFGELKTKKTVDGQDIGITLQMVTSNLSQSQPYDLPFKDRLFVFQEDEFYHLFPKTVVDFLKQVEASPKQRFLPSGYYFLPAADKLPVVVAMRMSLSFPLLLSAVPLYTISQEASNQDLQKNWFSDGGISSNFPIHFFDAWLPSRPTFGINLTSLPAAAFTETQIDGETKTLVNPKYFTAEAIQTPSSDTDMDKLSKAIYLPRADDPMNPEWVKISNWFNFIGAIFSTAQNYRDNMQTMLPSYRERVVEVRLSDDEGGLNLLMPQNTIRGVIQKGEKAGDKILNYFNFSHHQWVRFQVLMGLLEEQLQKMEQVLEQKLDYEKLAQEQLDSEQEEDKNKRYPYIRQLSWLNDALHRVGEIKILIKGWNQPVLSQDPPLPEPILRVTPEL